MARPTATHPMSPQAQAQLKLYCELGPKRSIDRLVRKLHAANPGHYKGKPETLARHLKELSRKHNWQQLVKEYDQEQAERVEMELELRRKAKADAVDKLNDDQQRLWTALGGQSIVRINDLLSVDATRMSVYKEQLKAWQTDAMTALTQKKDIPDPPAGFRPYFSAQSVVDLARLANDITRTALGEAVSIVRQQQEITGKDGGPVEVANYDAKDARDILRKRLADIAKRRGTGSLAGGHVGAGSPDAASRLDDLGASESAPA